MNNFPLNLYPQNEFARAICLELEKNYPDKSISGILDAPCGNGEVSWMLSRYFTGLKVEGIDLSAKAVSRAKQNYNGSLLDFNEADMYTFLDSGRQWDCICVVNAFFLMPDHDRLLMLLHKALKAKGSLFFIIPNVEGQNYRNFVKGDKTTNRIELNAEGMKDYLRKNSFSVTAVSGICYSSFYGRSWLKIWRRHYRFYLSLENRLLKNLSFLFKPNYLMLRACKTNQERK
jgi:trans-aconitate methyltransferase